MRYFYRQVRAVVVGQVSRDKRLKLEVLASPNRFCIARSSVISCVYPWFCSEDTVESSLALGLWSPFDLLSVAAAAADEIAVALRQLQAEGMD